MIIFSRGRLSKWREMVSPGPFTGRESLPGVWLVFCLVFFFGGLGGNETRFGGIAQWSFQGTHTTDLDSS